MPKMHLDFVILTSQHCGSHLLATALDSHPKIRCFGELALKRGKTKEMGHERVLREARGKTSGCIMHLNQRSHFAGWKFDRVIILARMSKPKSKKKIPGGGNLKLELGHKHADKVIRVTYDEMTEGGHIERLPDDVCKRLCDFLDVQPRRLLTWLVKGEYEKQIGIHGDWRNEHLPNPRRAEPLGLTIKPRS